MEHRRKAFDVLDFLSLIGGFSSILFEFNIKICSKIT